MSTDLENISAEAAIRQLYDSWSAAVRRKDLDTVLAFYTDDLLAFDAILKLQFKGRAAYAEHWRSCMEYCPAQGKESVFDVEQLQVQSEGSIAFAHGLVHCGFREGDQIEASWMRMTAGLRQHEGEWKIAHEHFSAPFEMPSGKAMFHLSPDDTDNAPRPVPAGMATVTPHLVCGDASAAMDFYKRAFNAMEMERLEMDGSFMHGSVVIGDSVVMIGQEDERCGSASPRSLKGTPVTLHLYVTDADRAFQQAIQAGAKEIMPVSEMFWGDRYGVVEDPYGHRWSLATHVRDLSAEQIQSAARDFFRQGGM